MQTIEYYEDDIIRIIDMEDILIYVFTFLGDQSHIYRMHDSNFNGESSHDHANYVDSCDEIAFIFSPYDDPSWPVLVEYNG